MKKLLSVGVAALALTLANWSSARAGTEFNGLGCGDCIDTWSVSCTGKTRYLCASVADSGIFYDVDFQVMVVGQKPPGSLFGQAVDERAPMGGGSSPACLTRPTPGGGAMKGIVIVSEPNKVGDENYAVTIQCYDDSMNPTPTTAILKQDQ